MNNSEYILTAFRARTSARLTKIGCSGQALCRMWQDAGAKDPQINEEFESRVGAPPMHDYTWGRVLVRDKVSLSDVCRIAEMMNVTPKALLFGPESEMLNAPLPNIVEGFENA